MMINTLRTEYWRLTVTGIDKHFHAVHYIMTFLAFIIELSLLTLETMQQSLQPYFITVMISMHTKVPIHD